METYKTGFDMEMMRFQWKMIIIENKDLLINSLYIFEIFLADGFRDLRRLMCFYFYLLCAEI